MEHFFFFNNQSMIANQHTKRTMYYDLKVNN